MISRVFIADDDTCDSCHQQDRQGVCFGPQKPVICKVCMQQAVDALNRPTQPLLEALMEQHRQRKPS